MAYFYLSLCILLWGLIPVVSKIILKELTNIEMLFYSNILSSLIMFFLLIFKRRIKRLRDYKFRDYAKMTFLGFLGVYLYYILLYGAFERVPASEGFILAYTWPILIIILSSFILKEGLNFKKILGISISFIGIVIIVMKGKIFSFSFSNIVGDTLAISGAFSFALFSVLGKRHRFDEFISVFIYFSSSILFLLPFFFFKTPKIPSLNIIPYLIINGFFINGISYVFWFKSLEYGKTHIVSNSVYLTPFVSLVYIYLFLKEKIPLFSIIGLILIISGVMIQLFKGETNE